MPTSPRKKVTPVSDWKKTPEPIELPSGKFMLVKNTSLASFVLTGQIPNSLMSVIQGSVNSKKSKSGEAIMAEITDDPKAIIDLFSMVDKYVTLVAIEPEVHMPPEDPTDRDDDLLYTDEIDQADKMYLFQRAVGGTTDLERFRGELAAGMDLVQQREDVVLPAKRAPRPKRAVR